MSFELFILFVTEIYNMITFDNRLKLTRIIILAYVNKYNSFFNNV